jgi:hypothetical protein
MLPLRAYGWWTLLGVSLVVGLAALVRLADPTGEPDHLTGAIRLPQLVTWTIVGLFGLAALVMGVDLVRRMRSKRHEDESLSFGRAVQPRPPWLVALAQILSLVNFVVIGYLLWKNVLPFADFMALGGAGGAGGMLPHEPPPDAPFFVTWTFALLALLAGAGALAFAVWLTSSDRLAKWWEPDEEATVPSPMVEAVDESLEDLRAEPDARRAIIRSYARFERAAAAVGLQRERSQTPMEFMREALRHLPGPRDAVRALTGLFELARFSDRPLGEPERTRALDALDDIKGAIDEAAADVAR